MTESAPLPSTEMVEAELAMDLRVYGSCYWRVVDGEKVRVHPCDVITNANSETLHPCGTCASETTGEQP